MARELVVPWSKARMAFMAGPDGGFKFGAMIR